VWRTRKSRRTNDDKLVAAGDHVTREQNLAAAQIALTRVEVDAITGLAIEDDG